MGVRTIISRLKKAISRESGAVTVEFVILFPAVFLMFVSAFELSLYLARDVMLERALDVNVRLLRLGTLDPPTQDELQKRVCHDAIIFQDCPNSVRIELTRVSTNTWDLPTSNVTCVNREEEIQPELGFDLGNQNDLMIVRACAVLDPQFKTTPMALNLPREASGGYTLIATSTFVNEP